MAAGNRTVKVEEIFYLCCDKSATGKDAGNGKEIKIIDKHVSDRYVTLVATKIDRFLLRQADTSYERNAVQFRDSNDTPVHDGNRQVRADRRSAAEPVAKIIFFSYTQILTNCVHCCYT